LIEALFSIYGNWQDGLKCLRKLAKKRSKTAEAEQYFVAPRMSGNHFTQ
jgi:hypothetical protein